MVGKCVGVFLLNNGGIIALVDDVEVLLRSANGEEAILNPCDYLLDDKTNEEMDKYLSGQKKGKQERNKRLLKRRVI